MALTVTPEIIERVKAMRVSGKLQDQIAVEVGVAQGTISKILRGSGLGGRLTIKQRSLTNGPQNPQ